MLSNYVTGEIVIDPYYPCIKYKYPADPKLDGTNYFIVAESMHLNGFNLRYEELDCTLSFTCEKNQKAFYKLTKDCLRFRIDEVSLVFPKTLLIQLDTVQPFQIESDYHSASYLSKNLNTWIFTNRTEIILNYELNRLGQLRTN